MKSFNSLNQTQSFVFKDVFKCVYSLRFNKHCLKATVCVQKDCEMFQFAQLNMITVFLVRGTSLTMMDYVQWSLAKNK